jgi:hypothetical protein
MDIYVLSVCLKLYRKAVTSAVAVYDHSNAWRLSTDMYYFYILFL